MVCVLSYMSPFVYSSDGVVNFTGQVIRRWANYSESVMKKVLENGTLGDFTVDKYYWAVREQKHGNVIRYYAIIGYHGNLL